MARRYDMVVVGGGVNGMVCAYLAGRRGLDVLLVEGHHCLGGGVRTTELTLPGFHHDVCSAVHPFGRSSPVLRELGLENEGLEWIDPPAVMAHPLVGEEAVLLYQSLQQTVEQLGSGGKVYRRLMDCLIADWDHLESSLLGPALRPPTPGQLLRLLRFGPMAVTPAAWLGPMLGRRGAALWAGLAAHSLLKMEDFGSSAIACVLGLLAHKVGWPLPKGGAARISDALENKLSDCGVEIELGRPVTSLSDLPPCRAAIFDLSAKPLLRLLGPALSASRRRALSRFKLGPGVFKVDYALCEPVPWDDPTVAQAGTVHLGGTLQQIADSERAVWQGRIAEQPFLLGVQPSLFDPTRAPQGKHTFWVYLHTPNGSHVDALEILETQMERYAPGFRETVLSRRVHTSADFERYNPNYVGGDILGGANSLSQVVARPFFSHDPYHLGGNLFCCSASVPPGGGIHGMGGYHAFRSAEWRFFH